MKRNTKIAKNIALALAIGFASSAVNTTAFATDLPVNGNYNQGGKWSQPQFVGDDATYIERTPAIIPDAKITTVYEATEGNFDMLSNSVRGIKSSGKNVKIYVDAKKEANIGGYIYSDKGSGIHVVTDEGKITLGNLQPVPSAPATNGNNVPAHSVIGVASSEDAVLSFVSKNNGVHFKTEVLSKDTANVIVKAKTDTQFDKPYLVEGASGLYINAEGDNTMSGVFSYDSDYKRYDKANGTHSYAVSEKAESVTPFNADGKINVIGVNNTFNEGKSEQPDRKNLPPFAIRLHDNTVMNAKAENGNTVTGDVIVNPSTTLNLTAKEGANNLTKDVYVASDENSLSWIAKDIKENVAADKQSANLNLDAKQGNTLNNLTVGAKDVNMAGSEEGFEAKANIESHDAKTVLTGTATANRANSKITFNTTNTDKDANKLENITANLGGNIEVNAQAGGNTIANITSNTDGKINVSAGDKGNEVGNINTAGGNVALDGTKGGNTVTAINSTMDQDTKKVGNVALNAGEKENTVTTINTDGGKVNLKAKTNTVTGNIKAVNGNHQNDEANTAENSDIVLNGTKNVLQGTVEAENSGFIYLGSTDANEVNADVTMKSKGKIVVNAKNTNTLKGNLTAEGGQAFIESTDGGNNFGELASTEAGLIDVKSKDNNVIAKNVVADGGTVKLTTTGDESKNIFNEGTTATVDHKGTLTVNGRNGNELNGTIDNKEGTLTVTAIKGNNTLAGTLENKGLSTISTEGANGKNIITGTVKNTGNTLNLNAQQGTNEFQQGAKVESTDGLINAIAKTNDVQAGAKVGTEGNGQLNLFGTANNTIAGTVEADGGNIIISAATTTNNVTGKVEAKKGNITLEGVKGNELGGEILATGGTVTAKAIGDDANNNITGTLKADGNNANLKLEANKGKNIFKNKSTTTATNTGVVQADAKVNEIEAGATVEAQGGNVVLNSTEATVVSGTLNAETGTINVTGQNATVNEGGKVSTTGEGIVIFNTAETNTINGAIAADKGTININGKNNQVNEKANLSTDNSGSLSLKANEKNTVLGTIDNKNGSVSINGANNAIGGTITNTKGAMEITATTGKNELTGTINSAASLKVEATAGNNEFKGNLTANAGETNLNAENGQNIFDEKSATTADKSGKITAKAKNNVINKDAKVSTKENGTVNLLGTEGNTVDGTLESAGGTLTLDAKANNNTINGTVKATAGTINLDAKAGQNVFAANSSTVASGKGHINATAKTNDIQEKSLVSSVANGEVTITGEANTINGKVSSTGNSKTTVEATKENNTVGATATIEASGESTTTIKAAKDNTVAAGATISTKDKGTVKFEAGANNTFNNDINTEGGTLNITAQTGANTFNGTVETNKGTIDVKAEQDNTFAKDVTITDGTLKVKSNNGNNVFKGKVKGTNSTIDVEAKENNTFEQDLAVELGNTHIKGKNNNFIGEVKADQAVMNIEANNKNTFEKLMTAQNDAKVIISAKENEFKNGLTADNKGIITVKSDVTNISGPITATKGGVINLSYGQATINGDINSKDEGSQVNVNAVDGDTKAKTTIKGKSDAREGGTINLELTAGSVLDGSLNNHAGKDGVDKGTINLTMHGENIFTNGKDNPNQNDDKPSINATTGAVWNPGGDKGRVISSIDNLAGVGIINGKNADINVEHFVNTKDKDKENVSRIEFHTNLTKDDHGTITIGKAKDDSLNRHTTADLVKDKDRPRLTVVALDYKDAVKKAQNNEDLNLIIGGSTPGAYLDGYVDYADKNIKDTVFKDPLIVVWDEKDQQWKITLNSNAQQSNLGKLIYQIAPMATYGSMVSNLLNDTYNQRMGAALYDPSRASGPWARTYHDRFGQGDAYRSLVTGIQAGFRTVKNKEEAQVIHAVAVQADTHKLSFPGIDGSAKAHGTMLDYYYTKITKDGKYLDLNAKVGNINSKYQVEGKNGTVKGDYTLKVFSTGAEGGYTKNFGKDDKAYIQTQAQLQYTYLSKVNCHIESADVNMSHVNSLMGRAGFNVGMRTSDSTLAYVKANVLHEFMAKQNITVADNSTGGAGVTTSIRNRDTFYTIGLGVTHSMKDNSRVFADVEKVLGNNYKNSYRLNFGAQFMY